MNIRDIEYRGLWSESWLRLKKNRLALFGLLLVVFLIAVALFAPCFATHDPYKQPIWTDGEEIQLQPPGPGHWFGTDYYGRDIFSRVVYGTRISLRIGIISTLVSVVLGIVIGTAAGYYGSFVDDIITWFTNVMFAFPFLLFVMALVAYLPPGLTVIYAAIGLVSWPEIARVVRGQVLAVKEKEFVEAARALGLSDFKIITKHILPNVMAPVIVQGTMGIGSIIMLESSLSFLGLGIQPPEPSWGYMINAGRPFLMAGKWWWSVFPGLGIMITVLGFNLLGDGLRDALDPRQ